MPNYVYNYCSFTLNSAGLSKQSQHCQLLVISPPAFITLEDLDVLIVQSCNVHVFTCLVCLILLSALQHLKQTLNILQGKLKLIIQAIDVLIV